MIVSPRLNASHVDQCVEYSIDFIRIWGFTTDPSQAPTMEPNKTADRWKDGVGAVRRVGEGVYWGGGGRSAHQAAELIHHCHKLVEYISLGRYGPGKMVPHSSFS